MVWAKAVPFKSVVCRGWGGGGGGGGGGDERSFDGDEGSNSELFYPVRLDMISGRRRGGGGYVERLIIFRSDPPPHF